jgi:hypothetical protein
MMKSTITVRRFLVGVSCLVLAGLAAAAVYVGFFKSTSPTNVSPSPSLPAAASVQEATSEQVHQFCGSCHAYPPPDTFPRAAWKHEVLRGYDFFEEMSAHPWGAPPVNGVIAYYENRAPDVLPPLPPVADAGPLPLRFERTAYRLPEGASVAAISNVNLVHLFDERRLDILVCDMYGGRVLAMRPYDKAPALQLLGRLSHPAHAEVVDLDGDGIKDILVADLGSMTPTDKLTGSVIWLRGLGNGQFQPIPLLEHVGRVADVQVADFNGDGKLDLIVAVFGWQRTGEIIYLENHTTDWSRPRFEPHVLDKRHGAIHVPVCDLNGDGRPDFVALISQEHETIVAFLNEGNGQFRKETIYQAPHPAYGSSGIQLVDLNGDGKLDVLYTNGDILDPPYLLKPYHSIQWLENRGSYPFVHHHLTSMYGVHRAVAADLRGQAKLDIVAVSFLPPSQFPQRQEQQLDSVILLEQTEPGQFVRHRLERITCDHVSCAVGDLLGTGRKDLVIGNFGMNEGSLPADALTIWKNQGGSPK